MCAELQGFPRWVLLLGEVALTSPALFWGVFLEAKGLGYAAGVQVLPAVLLPHS